MKDLDLIGLTIVASHAAVELGAIDEVAATQLTEAVAAAIGLTMDDYFEAAIPRDVL